MLTSHPKQPHLRQEHDRHAYVSLFTFSVPSVLTHNSTDGDRKTTVKVVDICPRGSCNVGHIDLSPAAFAALAPLDVGVIDVAWVLED